MKLDLDEKQALYDLSLAPGFAVLEELFKAIVNDFAKGVLNSSPDDERRLVVAKAQYDGARKFYSLVTNLITETKKEQ